MNTKTILSAASWRTTLVVAGMVSAIIHGVPLAEAYVRLPGDKPSHRAAVQEQRAAVQADIAGRAQKLAEKYWEREDLTAELDGNASPLADDLAIIEEFDENMMGTYEPPEVEGMMVRKDDLSHSGFGLSIGAIALGMTGGVWRRRGSCER